MPYATLDDRYDDSRKIKRAWKSAAPNPVGLHAMAITYCNRHETDGLVDPEWLEEKLPNERTRERFLAQMVELSLFSSATDGCYLVHDFLDYNASRAEREAKRSRDAARKRAGRNGSVATDSNPSPGGVQAESVSRARDATPSHATPSQESARAEEFGVWLAHHQQVTKLDPPGEKTKARKAIIASFGERRDEGYSLDDLKYATVGAFTDKHRRENGYYTCESVLRPTKIHDLVQKGKRQMAAQRAPDSPEATRRRLEAAEQ